MRTIIVFLLALAAGLSLLAQPIVVQRGNQFDFYPHYVGAAAYWQGESPFTEAVTERIQQGYYGGPLPPGGDEYRLPFPAYAYILLAPALLFNPATATAIWMGLQGAAIVAALALWMARPSLGRLALATLLLVAYRYNLTTYLLGQFAGWVLLWLSLAVWFLEKRRDTPAGFSLALATIQPTLAGPLAAVLLLAYTLNGRWRVAAGFTGLLAALTLLTFAQIGWWIPDWLANISRYSSYQPFMAWVPALFSPLVALPALGLVLLSMWQRLPAPDIGIVSIIALLLVVPQTGGYFLVLPLPALILALRRAEGRVRPWVYGLAGLLLISSWVFQAFDRDPRKIEALLIPALLALLWWLTKPASHLALSKTLHKR